MAADGNSTRVAETLLIQKLVATLAPEVDQNVWARVSPLGLRWLVRSASCQLVEAVSYQAEEAAASSRRRKRKRETRNQDSQVVVVKAA